MRNPRRLVLPAQIFDKVAAQRETAPGDRHLRVAVARCRGELRLQRVQEMRGGKRGADDRDRSGVGDAGSGSKHRRTAEAVPDQERRRPAFGAQPCRRREDVRDVRAEPGIGEIAFAAAEAGKVEAQRGDAPRGEPGRDPARRQDVLAAGKTMREQRPGTRRAVGQVEPAAQPLAPRIRETPRFDPHRLARIATDIPEARG